MNQSILKQDISSKSETEIAAEGISHLAAQLTLVEVVLGAFIHGLKIPFGGNLLSLNQGFFMTRAVKLSKQSRAQAVRYPIYISTIVGLLKSLSPAGNKLGPMLSISAQGFLFSFGILLLGVGLAGQIFGMALLSLWAFVQPVLTLLLFFGKDLITAFEFYLQKLNSTLGLEPLFFLNVFLAVVSVKVILACMIPILMYKKSEEELEKWIQPWAQKAGTQFKKIEMNPASSNWASVWMALRDLRKPFFLFSLLIMIVFFAFTESDYLSLVWKSLRPLAIAFLFFYVSRSPWIRNFALKAKGKGYFPRVFEFFERTQKKLLGF
ncbi:MAG: hypothetical protein AB7O96_10470 [Pseudobdellovibrionaceae bacterium]